MKRIFTLVVIAAALLANSANAQAPKPKLTDFKTLEAYLEALVDWKIDQRQPALRQQPPTATEIFNLRTQCKAMADESWLTAARAFPKDSVMHWAHYSPRTNHCYVEMNTSTTMAPTAASGTAIATYETTWSLDDVQTGERLAWARESSGGREDKFGSVSGEDLSKLSRPDRFARAMEYMVDLTRE